MPQRILSACIVCLLFLATGLIAGPFTGQIGQTADTTLSEVWERNGARLYYDALMRPRQLNMNGARWEDPALNRRLPPLHEPQIRRASTRRAVTPAVPPVLSPVVSPVTSANTP